MRISTLLIIIVGLTFSLELYGQKTTFYKDKNLWKEVPEKRAKYKKTEIYKTDTLVIRSFRISDNLLLTEAKWLKDKPVGVWRNFSLDGELALKRDFGELVYSSEPINGLFNNNSENNDCENCVIASLPDGQTILQFINTKINYPNESKDLGNSGTVYLRFIISKDGTAKAHSIMKGVDPYIDMEAWQLIKKMPKWNPAMKNGQPIESYWTLPVRFRLM